MEAVAVVTILAVLQAFWFAIEVGQARLRHGVKAPACSGHPEFDRAYRVHENTIEQLVLVLPSMWIFAWYVHGLIAAGLGLLFIVGRILYRNAYRKDPKSRSAGFGLGALALAVLAIGGLIGAVVSWAGLA